MTTSSTAGRFGVLSERTRITGSLVLILIPFVWHGSQAKFQSDADHARIEQNEKQTEETFRQINAQLSDINKSIVEMKSDNAKAWGEIKADTARTSAQVDTLIKMQVTRKVAL